MRLSELPDWAASLLDKINAKYNRGVWNGEWKVVEDPVVVCNGKRVIGIVEGVLDTGDSCVKILTEPYKYYPSPTGVDTEEEIKARREWQMGFSLPKAKPTSNKENK